MSRIFERIDDEPVHVDQPLGPAKSDLKKMLADAVRNTGGRSPEMIAADKRVGARIREARKAAGLSQAALGERIGLSFGPIQHMEHGRTRATPSHLGAIANATGRTVSFFYGEAPDA